MKSYTALKVGWALVLCAGVSSAANGLDITFSSNGVIRDGDDYDDVFVYGDTTVVDVTGGTIGKIWSRDKSIVNVSGGRIMYAQAYEQGTINITGGFVTEPSIWDIGGTINISGGTCWNVEVGNGKLNVFGGQIAGLGISVPAPGGVVNVHGYGFEYYPFPGRSDGRLKGFWPDGTPLSIDFLRDAYRAVVLHEISRDFAPIADAGEDQTVLATIGTIAVVALDGSASYDPDHDELTYEWTWTLNGSQYVANGQSPTIMLPVGKHSIELIVSDGANDSKADAVVITVQTLTEQIHAVIAGKLKLMEEIDAMLKKEQRITDALNTLLSDGDYGDLARNDIIAAREMIYSSIQYQEKAKIDLQTSIENLEDTLLLLALPEETEK
ncbi:MAG: hypothetical protein U9Q07_11050 [Planctomycetota bacterium]|nr:hypothetical protein [Planctomycetota bacterium]